MKFNILITGLKSVGKSTFIHTYLNILSKPLITIGIDLYKYVLNKYNKSYKVYLWDTGDGLYYLNIIESILKKMNIIIIIGTNDKYKLISDILLLIKKHNCNIKNILIILNNKDILKYNENIIKNLNENINFSFFYIDCRKYEDVKLVFNYIENNII